MTVNHEQQINPTACKNDARFCSYSSAYLGTWLCLLLTYTSACSVLQWMPAPYLHRVWLQGHLLLTAHRRQISNPSFAKDCCLFLVSWLVSNSLKPVLWQALSLHYFWVSCPTYFFLCPLGPASTSLASPHSKLANLLMLWRKAKRSSREVQILAEYPLNYFIALCASETLWTVFATRKSCSRCRSRGVSQQAWFYLLIQRC